MQITHRHKFPQNRSTQPQGTPTQAEYEQLIGPLPSDHVAIGEDAPNTTRIFQNMAEAKASLAELSYHGSVDPFVASVAGGTYAGKVDEPSDATTLKVEMRHYYEKDFEIEVGLQHGPDAPMTVILPGIYGDRDGGFNTLLKKTAHERGMNYLVIPNALSGDAMADDPIDHPGNPGREAEIIVDVLKALKKYSPEHFDQVSLTGYSYGALLGANIARRDEEIHTDEERVVTGGLFAVSPPDDLYDSMLELDGLREQYKKGAGSIIGTALKYRREVKKHGYERFPEAEVAERGPGTNITEIKIADLYGSRNEMKKMVSRVDSHFGHRKLPRRRPGGPKRPPGRDRRKEALDKMTYKEYASGWFAEDKWLIEKGMTPESMADEFSFKKALDTIERTPVLTLLSADDYIINETNVATFRELEAADEKLEATRVLDTGGHVGVLFNPEVRQTLVDFLYSTAKHPENFG